MRSYAVLIVALSGSHVVLSALANDTPIDIQTDQAGDRCRGKSGNPSRGMLHALL